MYNLLHIKPNIVFFLISILYWGHTWEFFSVISDANIVKIEKFLNLEIKGLSKSKSGERKDAYIKTRAGNF